MALRAEDVYALLGNQIAGVSSGFDHAEQIDATQYDIYFKDGTVIHANLPQGQQTGYIATGNTEPTDHEKYPVWVQEDDGTTFEDAVCEILDSKKSEFVGIDNVKTINGESIIGKGNIEIQGGGSSYIDFPLEKYLEYGNISTTNTFQFVNSLSRIATPKPLKLHKGDKVIWGSDDRCLMIYYKNNEFKQIWWVSNKTEYDITIDGIYWLLFSHTTESNLANKNVISANCFVRRPSTEDFSDLICDYRLYPNNGTLRMINHRGFNYSAPENTIHSFKLSKVMGFSWIESDVQFTSDRVPVIIHDATVNRTSNGSGNVADKTLAELKALDFGSWFSEEFANTQILTFEEFCAFARQNDFKVAMEIKVSNASQSEIENLVDTVRKYGFNETNWTWISFYTGPLTTIKNYDAKASLGYIASNFTNAISKMSALKTTSNEVWFDAGYEPTESDITELIANGFKLGRYAPDGIGNVESCNPYTSIITTNSMNYPSLKAFLNEY